MTRTRIGSFAALLALAAAVPLGRLSAQQLGQLTPGQRVRITVPSAGFTQEVATLVAVHEDSVVISRTQRRSDNFWRIDTIRAAVPLGEVRTLEVSRGRRSVLGPAIAVGSGVGTVVGAVIGAIHGSNSWKECTETGWFACFWYPSRGDLAISGALSGGLVGLGVGVVAGAVVGSAMTSERWLQVPLNRVHPTLTPLSAGHLGFGVALTF